MLTRKRRARTKRGWPLSLSELPTSELLEELESRSIAVVAAIALPEGKGDMVGRTFGSGPMVVQLGLLETLAETIRQTLRDTLKDDEGMD